MIERAAHPAPGPARDSRGGLSLLVLLAISVQLVVGAEAAVAAGALGGERVCLRRLPTEVVRVIRDLVERHETQGEAALVVAAPSGRAPSVAVPRGEGGPVEPLGAWLLDLPPPTLA